MRVTFLGTGAGEPTPDPWCTCPACAAARALGGRDVRLRSAALINDDLLIDLGPDVPAACARLGIALGRVQAALVTHPHRDHLDFGAIGGRDRTWPGTPLPALDLYASRAACDQLANPNGRPYDLAKLRVTPHPIGRGACFTVATGGATAADPRLPVGAGTLPACPPRRYDIWTLHANHFEHAGSPDRFEPMLFVVRQTAGPEVAGRGALPALLYATDTDTFLPETWRALDRVAAAGVRIGMAVIDGTYGTRVAGGNHMTTGRMVAHHRELARRGLLTAGATRFATHLLHTGNPPHDELAALLAPHGIAPAYDGLAVAL